MLLPAAKVRDNLPKMNISKESTISGIINNVPKKKGDPSYNEKVLKRNRDAFESGFAARKKFGGPQDEKIIII